MMPLHFCVVEQGSMRRMVARLKVARTAKLDEEPTSRTSYAVICGNVALLKTGGVGHFDVVFVFALEVVGGRGCRRVQ